MIMLTLSLVYCSQFFISETTLYVANGLGDFVDPYAGVIGKSAFRKFVPTHC